MPDMKVADLRPPKHFRIVVDVTVDGGTTKYTLEPILLRSLLHALQESGEVRSFTHNVMQTAVVGDD